MLGAALEFPAGYALEIDRPESVCVARFEAEDRQVELACPGREKRLTEQRQGSRHGLAVGPGQPVADEATSESVMNATTRFVVNHPPENRQMRNEARAVRVPAPDAGHRAGQDPGWHEEPVEVDALVLEGARIRALQGPLPPIDALVEARHHPEARVQRQIAAHLARLVADSGAKKQQRRAIRAGCDHDLAGTQEEPRRGACSVSPDGAGDAGGAGSLRDDALDVEIRKNSGARRGGTAQIRSVDAELRVLGAAEVAAAAAVAPAGVPAHR